MARKLRIEYPGACYHIINRGNYRDDIFATEGAMRAFELALFEAAEKSGWEIHAFIVMRNHFHLAVVTPEPNLVAGMHWLEVTFATRFNRLRDERGHLFQGRYKALLIEPGQSLALTCDYIHLNPVRCGAFTVDRLVEYRHSSYWYLLHPRARPSFLRFDIALLYAGDLADTRAGWRAYAEHLEWQMEFGPLSGSGAHGLLSTGWILGSTEFREQIREEFRPQPQPRAWTRAGAAEIREARWHELLDRALGAVDISRARAQTEAKSAPWKLAIAAWMKQRSQVRNGWLCAQLNLGTPAAFSRNLTEFRRTLQPGDPVWKQLTSISET